jgi:hypothetical protein
MNVRGSVPVDTGVTLRARSLGPLVKARAFGMTHLFRCEMYGLLCIFRLRYRE